MRRPPGELPLARANGLLVTFDLVVLPRLSGADRAVMVSFVMVVFQEISAVGGLSAFSGRWGRPEKFRSSRGRGFRTLQP